MFQGLTVTLAELTTLLSAAKNTAWKMSFLFCEWTKPWSVLALWLRSYESQRRTGRQPSVKTVKAVTLSCTAVTTSNVRVTQHVTILQVFHFTLRHANSWSTTVCVSVRTLQCSKRRITENHTQLQDSCTELYQSTAARLSNPICWFDSQFAACRERDETTWLPNLTRY